MYNIIFHLESYIVIFSISFSPFRISLKRSKSGFCLFRYSHARLCRQQSRVRAFMYFHCVNSSNAPCPNRAPHSSPQSAERRAFRRQALIDSISLAARSPAFRPFPSGTSSRNSSWICNMPGLKLFQFLIMGNSQHGQLDYIRGGSPEFPH